MRKLTPFDCALAVTAASLYLNGSLSKPDQSFFRATGDFYAPLEKVIFEGKDGEIYSASQKEDALFEMSFSRNGRTFRIGGSCFEHVHFPDLQTFEVLYSMNPAVAEPIEQGPIILYLEFGYYGPKLIAFEEKSPLEDRMLRLRYEFDGTYEIRIRDDSKKSKDPLGEILGVPCNVQVSGEKVKQ